MEKIGLIDDLIASQYLEEVAIIKQQQHRLQSDCDRSRSRIANVLKQVGNSQDVGLIIQAEKLFISKELESYSNSKEMQSSLISSLRDINATEITLSKVCNPEQYKIVNDDHSNPRKRQGDLPLDDVRLFFKSQLARLDTAKKHRSDNSEKQIIAQRRTNLVIAQKLYVSLQKQALGFGVINQ